jgi:hypothetical protein
MNYFPEKIESKNCRVKLNNYLLKINKKVNYYRLDLINWKLKNRKFIDRKKICL